jgi:hypothetical protein
MRSHYWSCSKFANWIRGTKKPNSASGEGWVKWRLAAKASHSIRYWIAEEGLDILENIVFYPAKKWDDLRSYIKNRWIDQTHALVARKEHLPRGQWRDVGNRFLPCLFDSLADFVETELAWQGTWVDDKYKLPFWQKFRMFRFGTWRSREAGIAHLDWELTLVYDEHNGCWDKNDSIYGTPTHQAISAKEIKDLYLWWKDIYPNRPDPYDASGWSAYCDEKRNLASPSGDKKADCMSLFDDSKVTPELKKKGDKACKLLVKIEKQYEKEDTEMMVRLIKIRERLWT